MDKYEERRLRLLSLRDDHCDGNASELARRIGRDATYVARMLYPEGKPGRKRIGDDMMEIIEKSFNLPRGWMDGITSHQNSNVTYIEHAKPMNSFPLISWVSAGSWLEAVEPYRKDDIDIWPETTVNASEGSFWLRVRGDSMTSPTGFTVPEGMIILVDPHREVSSGKLVVAKLENENEATFKQYMTDAGRKYLKALNPHHPPTIINGNCKIIGVVVDIKWEHIP
ncbi:S24 family peptidase [Yersinia sp. 2105 StPb PI]|uniref:LexA family protein n=1 Tax=Yersinia TaxID=629 RepID=UPI000FFC8ED1|nr:S24 family peptidase [Yersinia sp. 2105 StPb PI]ELI8162585.1 LexA family transcriptional repressor [Yersinia enterocolitica]ELW8974600.1 LexA family transcriptional repressor [Yersinia enterocolitica]RXA96929.1 LexA family transcriptional repressor [Yersinia sp. 2105 StPb PI]HDL7808625.1 LexA family transcriptional repressor [Yersinia enterocolitica]HDL8117407.1 LexA family transcriptional repressor [Yersinia enterocolitica]